MLSIDFVLGALRGVPLAPGVGLDLGEGALVAGLLLLL